MNSQQPPLRFLVIGCGGIFTNAHSKAFFSYPEHLCVTAACDPSPRARKELAEQLASIGEVQTFEDPATALAACRDKVDAALILSPHYLHYPLAQTCLEAGLPVLIEKPVCNNLTETRNLMALGETHDLLVVAGQNRRYDPKPSWLKKWMSENPLHFGDIQSFDVRAWQNIGAWIATKPDKNADFWILDKERAGGGVVVSLLVHYLDMIRHLTGRDFVKVSAQGRFEPPFKNGAESSCCALLTLDNGAVGTMHGSYLAPRMIQPNECFNLFGEHGYVGDEQGWKYATTGGAEPEGWAWQFEGVEDVPLDESLELDPFSFTAQLLDFSRAVEKGTRPRNAIENNFNTMAVIEAIYESMNLGGISVDVVTLEQKA